jgi:dienelactone hydrolase
MLQTILVAAAAATAAPSSSTSCSPASAFAGTICTPPTPGKHPAILLLGGSEGGDSMKPLAARFAQQGYVAVSVAYFGAPGLPQTLENVPVDAIGKALDDIGKRSDADANRIAIMGGSKGGELALLAASVYPQIHAVVAYVPSPFAWQGIPSGPTAAAPQSSWTFQGKALPFVEYTQAMGEQFANAYLKHMPLDLRIAYDDAIQRNANEIPAAMFHLENIHGPVLLIGADDDKLWDSDKQCELAMTYLKAHRHPYADRYVHYPDAGHLFLFQPPSKALTQVPLGPFTMLVGGSARGNAAAQAQAWPQIGMFLTGAMDK